MILRIEYIIVITFRVIVIINSFYPCKVDKVLTPGQTLEMEILTEFEKQGFSVWPVCVYIISIIQIQILTIIANYSLYISMICRSCMGYFLNIELIVCTEGHRKEF